MDTIRQTKLTVNIANVKHNINEIKRYVGDKVEIMPVIKARGYGTGISTLVSLFTDLKINILAVAVVDEGIALRERGYKGEILVLNQPLKEEIDKILEYELSSSICIKEYLIELNNKARINNKVVKVHLEIETGMGRTGIKENEINEFIKIIKANSAIKLNGIYTHFSSADVDLEYTEEQINKFEKMKSTIEKDINIKYIHACNTAGIINFKKAHYNLVRPGISIYGHLPDKSLKGKLNLLPTTTLKTKVSFIHEVEAGQSLSYSRSFVAERTTKVAVIPIGYADGIMRMYKGDVLIKGKRAKILGVINMDSTMVDITDIKNVEVGEDVYIWDNINIMLEEVAEKCNTINYEILSRLAPRVVKEFLKFD